MTNISPAVKMIKGKILVLILILLVAISVSLVACTTQTEEEKTKSRINNYITELTLARKMAIDKTNELSKSLTEGEIKTSEFYDYVVETTHCWAAQVYYIDQEYKDLMPSLQDYIGSKLPQYDYTSNEGDTAYIDWHYANLNLSEPLAGNTIQAPSN